MNKAIQNNRGPHRRFARKTLAALSAVALSCALMPAAAFADSGKLTTGTVEGDAVQATALSTQASTVKSAKKTTKKSAAFKIKRYLKKKTYSYVTGKWMYERPILKGNSAVVTKINKSLAKRYKTFMKTANTVINYAKEAGSTFAGATFLNTYDAAATYNANGYVSFKYTTNWYAGGVFNGGIVGDVYSLKTGKKLNVSQVVPGNAAQVKEAIVKAVAKKYNVDVYKSPYSWRDGSVNALITEKKISDIDFYLRGGKVVVAIDPYTIPGQRSALTVTLKGDYA